LFLRIWVIFGKFICFLNLLKKNQKDGGSPIFQQKEGWGVLILSYHSLCLRLCLPDCKVREEKEEEYGMRKKIDGQDEFVVVAQLA
jgi:hypothetical protein